MLRGALLLAAGAVQLGHLVDGVLHGLAQSGELLAGGPQGFFQAPRRVALQLARGLVHRALGGRLLFAGLLLHSGHVTGGAFDSLAQGAELLRRRAHGVFQGFRQTLLQLCGGLDEGLLPGSVLFTGLLLKRGGLDDGVLRGLADAGKLGDGGAHDFLHGLGGLGGRSADGFGEAARSILLHPRDGFLHGPLHRGLLLGGVALERGHVAGGGLHRVAQSAELLGGGANGVFQSLGQILLQLRRGLDEGLLSGGVLLAGLFLERRRLGHRVLGRLADTGEVEHGGLDGLFDGA